MIEIWIEKKGWNRIKDRLPGNYVWGIQEVGRRNTKGRAMTGIAMKINRELIEKGRKIETDREGLVGRGGREMEDNKCIRKKRRFGEDT